MIFKFYAKPPGKHWLREKGFSSGTLILFIDTILWLWLMGKCYNFNSSIYYDFPPVFYDKSTVCNFFVRMQIITLMHAKYTSCNCQFYKTMQKTNENK